MLYSHIISAEFIKPRVRPNRRPSFPPTMLDESEEEEEFYQTSATKLDNIERNILLYGGGGGLDGNRRFKPIDNEIPDSANVQANPGQGADEPQPVRNAGPNNTNSRQQQLNLGEPNGNLFKGNAYIFCWFLWYRAL